MSVKVNLLPGDVAKSVRSARVRNVAIGVAAGIVAALAGVTMLQLGAVTTAEENLIVAQDANLLLQARVSELAPFAELQRRRADAADAVSSALSREASIAGVLQDLAAVIPPTAEIQTINIGVAPEPTLPQIGGVRLSHGRLSVSGRVLVGLAPGFERLLLDVERAAAFDNVFGGGATVDEFDVSTFALDMDLGPEILTNRYVISGQAVQ